jgi:hypothetical protein
MKTTLYRSTAFFNISFQKEITTEKNKNNQKSQISKSANTQTLPEKEPSVTVSCTFRNCRYEIVIRKGNGKRLLINGIEQLFGTPIQPKANTRLNVECEI